MNDLAIHNAQRHIGHERDGSDAISFVLYNTKHYMAVDKATALADAINEAAGKRSGIADVDERVTLLSEDCDEQSSIFSAQINDLAEKVQQLMNEHGELSETVSVLESSICSCPDCVMHREKARHTAPPSVGTKEFSVSDCLDCGEFAGHGHVCHIEWPSGCRHPNSCESNGACGYVGCVHSGHQIDARPAWQRAKVGDWVEFKDLGGASWAGAVTRINEDPLCRLVVNIAGFEYIAENRSILSILPPEPAAPVQDGHNTAGHAGVSRSATGMQDVRDLARQAIDELEILPMKNDVFTIIDALERRGILSVAPQTVTTYQMFSFLNAYDSADDGTVISTLFEQHFPGLKVEG